MPLQPLSNAPPSHIPSAGSEQTTDSPASSPIAMPELIEANATELPTQGGVRDSVDEQEYASIDGYMYSGGSYAAVADEDDDFGSDEALGSPTSAELLDAISNDDIPYLLFRPAPANDSVDEQERTVSSTASVSGGCAHLLVPLATMESCTLLSFSSLNLTAQVLTSGALIG